MNQKTHVQKAQTLARGVGTTLPEHPLTAASNTATMTVYELRAFVLALFNAIGEISPKEAGDAFCREWDATFGAYR